MDGRLAVVITVLCVASHGKTKLKLKTDGSRPPITVTASSAAAERAIYGHTGAPHSQSVPDEDCGCHLGVTLLSI